MLNEGKTRDERETEIKKKKNIVLDAVQRLVIEVNVCVAYMHRCIHL